MSENEQRRDEDEIDPHAATPADADGGHPSGEGDDEEEEADQLVLSPPDAAAAPRDFALWAGVLFLAALTAYGPALRGQFLWDDDRHVVQNAALRTFEGLGAIWLTPGTTPQYYPLTHTTYWFEYQFLARGADGELNPLVFHVTNVLLHAGAATLLWFIFRRLRVPGAWVAAAVFALHPINVESVAWISERKNVLSAALMFGSILAYLKFAGVGRAGSGDEEGAHRSSGLRSGDAADDPASPNWDTYFIALGLFLAAMLSKTVACSAPAVLLVLLWWQRRLDRRHVVLLVPFFVLGLALAGVTVWMEQSHVIGAHAADGDWDLSLTQRVLIAGRAVWFYLGKLLVPIGLAFIYPRWDVNPADPVQWVYPLGLVAVLAALWALRGRIGRGPLAAALIYVGALVPALGFINIYPMRYSFVANHFQYHASAAAIAAIVAGAVVLLRRALGAAAEPQPAPAPASPAAAPAEAKADADADAARVSPTPYVIAGALLLVLVVLTWRLAGIYDNPVSLFEDTIAKNPGAWMAYHNLGTTLMNSGDVYDAAGNEEQARALREEAVERLRRAIELRPQHVSARNNLGIVLMSLGRIPEALSSFREAVERDPDNVDALANIGVALERLGQSEQAVAAFEVALATCQAQRPPRPEQCATIRQYIGRILARQGNIEAALAQYRAAARERPDDLSLQQEYGALLAQHGDKVTAAGVFAAILRRDPQHLDARLGLARLQWEVGRILEARAQLEIAAQIDPNSPKLLQAIMDWDQAYRAATQAAATQAAATQAMTSPATVPATAPLPTTAPAAP